MIDSKVASLEATAAPKGCMRDAVRTGVAQVARPLLDLVKKLEGHSQTAQGSAGGAAYPVEMRWGLLDTRQALMDTRKHMANLIKLNDPEMTVGLKTLVARLEHKDLGVRAACGRGDGRSQPLRVPQPGGGGGFCRERFSGRVGGLQLLPQHVGDHPAGYTGDSLYLS